jgi:hypothetical protein
MKTVYLQSMYYSSIKSCYQAGRVMFILAVLFALSATALMAQPLSSKQISGAKGYWDFNEGNDLGKAQIGANLITEGTPVAVEGIVPGDSAARVGYNNFFKCVTGLAGNNGGARLNKYTMIYDFKVLSVNDWHAFYQTDKNNSGDADCFINDGSGKIGIGKTGYSSRSVEPNKWHRLVIVADLQTTGGTYDYYLDGRLVNNYTVATGQTMLDDRLSPQDTLLLFADNDGENDTMDVSSFVLFDKALTAQEIYELGEADPLLPTGFPNSLQAYWNFNFLNPLKASAGENLILNGTHTRVAGPTDGDSAVRIGAGSYYKVNNTIAANGGGSKVNEFSLMVDFKVKDISVWHAIFQTDSTNTSDADCFIKKSAGTIGTSATGYTPSPITADKWHRLIIAADLKAAGSYSYYIDGVLAHSITIPASPSFIDDRFSLDKTLLLFADEDGEDGEIDVTTVAIFNQALSLTEVQSIGMFKIDPIIAADTNQILSQTDWPNLKAYWTFQDTSNIYKGSLGADDLIKKGPLPGNGNMGTGGPGGVVQKINGPSSFKKAIKTFTNTHFVAKHNIAPNGGVGATRVNDYTIMVDFRVPYLKDKAGYNSFYSLYPLNDNDGAIFIDEDGGLGDGRSGGYSNPAVEPYKWSRLVVSVSCGNFYKIFLNGKLLKTTTPANTGNLAVDGIFSLDSLLLIRGDQDGEDSLMDLSSFAIFDRPLTDLEVARLGGVPQPSSQIAGTTVQLIHNALDVNLKNVDVYIDGNKAISNFAFRTATPFTSIPSGSHRIAISKSGSAVDTAWNATTITLKADSSYLLMLTGVKDTASYLRKSTGGVNSGASIMFKYVLTPTVTASSAGTVNVILFHGSTDIAPVQILDPAVGSATDSLVYGTFNVEGSNPLPTYPYITQVFDRLANKAIRDYYSSLENHDGEAVTFMLSGVQHTTGNPAGTPTFGLYKVTAAGGLAILLDSVPPPPQNPKVQFIHNAADPATQNIDIWVDGNKAFNNLAFRKAGPFLPFKVKETKVIIYKAGTTSPILDSMTIALEGDKQYVVMITGVADTTLFNRTENNGKAIQFNMVVFDKAQKESGDANKTNVLFFNGATDINKMGLIDANSSAPLVSNITYGTFDALYQPINKGTVKWDLTSAATGNTILHTYGADFGPYAGKSIVVFTSGFLTTADEATGSPAIALYGVDSTGKTFAFTDLTPTTGVNEVIASNTISVYPNPASGAINVVTNNGEAATIRITSMNGKMVLNQSVNQTENTVNISDLTSGIYFYEVNTQNAVSRGKLVVQ